MSKHPQENLYELFGYQYAQLGIADTYYLGFRDVPVLMEEYNIRGAAIDHGCGAGRATRFLKGLGLNAIGVDRNAAMIAHALTEDPTGDYRLESSGTLKSIPDESVELVFQSSVLEEYPSTLLMRETFEEFYRVLRRGGHAIIVTASEELPRGEWLSFIYPERHLAPSSGGQVRCMVRNSELVFNDFYWTDRDLRGVFTDSGFDVLRLHQPIARGDEPYKWLDETTKPPWSVYVLGKKGA